MAAVKFEPGDMVECVLTSPLGNNDVAPPLELGKHYEIVEITLDKKGNQHISVGLDSKYNYVRSFETGEDLPKGDSIHWCHPSRFIKL